MTDLNRSARLMTVLTAVSRVSGFARVVVFASVFGKTFLANTYLTANGVPNSLFELFAAGMLQAALVPSMVRLMSDRRNAERVAGTTLTIVAGGLGVLGLLALVFRTDVMSFLTRDVTDPKVRADEIELGALFLWFFMPQLVFYGANIVATAALNARNRFALPVFAPTLNNVVVIGAYLWFGAVHEGRLTLDLTTAETWLVAGGTTLAVIVFCGLPVWGAWHDGFALRPRFAFRDPAIPRLFREGAWAAVFVALAEVQQIVMLRAANREAGAVTVLQFAFILFTLPHALFSVPVMTTRFPELSGAAHAEDWDRYRRSLSVATRGIVYLAVGATAVTAAVAHPAAEIISYGESSDLAAPIADATVAFAVGLVGFGLLLLFTRAFYALGDGRTPALVNAGVVAVTSVVMIAIAPSLSDRDLVTGLAATFAAGAVGGSLALGLLTDRRLGRAGASSLAVVRPAIRAAVAAVVAAALGWVVGWGIGFDDKPTAVAATAAAGLVALTAYVGMQWALGGPSPKLAVTTMGAGEERA
jgi:putative peptidoglycan lipid II flippase